MYAPINMAEFKAASQMAAGDTRNEIRVLLQDSNGNPVDVTGRPVTWFGRNKKGAVVKDRAATVYANGEVGIKLNASDNLEKGVLYLQFKVIWNDSKVENFPADGNLFLLLT